MQRVMVYVDGFNLHFGLKSKGWKRYQWLDLRRLSENLLQAEQRLAGVRYFTARILARPGNSKGLKRQTSFLEALETLPDLQIHYGHYLAKRQKCLKCGAIVAFPPNRNSVQLHRAATAAFRIGRKKLKDSQLPDQVTKPDGHIGEDSHNPAENRISDANHKYFHGIVFNHANGIFYGFFDTAACD